jgi:hypothetical protein
VADVPSTIAVFELAAMLAAICFVDATSVSASISSISLGIGFGVLDLSFASQVFTRLFSATDFTASQIPPPHEGCRLQKINVHPTTEVVKCRYITIKALKKQVIMVKYSLNFGLALAMRQG